VNIGAISSFILLDIAVIWHFVGLNKQYKSVKDWILYIICPIIGAAILVFVLTGFSWGAYYVAITHGRFLDVTARGVKPQ
ncbi:MAG: hypothetical protein IJG83_03415, partial [Thermoguttaceae bacterium]|nr:hypothetical protein [Thermoguttaceae bacterium]